MMYLQFRNVSVKFRCYVFLVSLLNVSFVYGFISFLVKILLSIFE